MAQKIDKIVSKHTECSICLQSYTRPKQLQPCLHSFCEHCIEQWAKQYLWSGQNFPCPICKTNVKIPPGGVQNFQNNTIINNLVDDLSKLAINEETCAIHPEECMNMICKQCNVYICAECTESHTGHVIRSLKAEMTSVSKAMVKEAKSKIHQFSLTRDSVKSSSEAFEAQYSAAKSDFISLMNETENVLKEKNAMITNYCEPEKQRLINEVRKSNESIGKLNDFISKADKENPAFFPSSKTHNELLQRCEAVVKMEDQPHVRPTIHVTIEKKMFIKRLRELLDETVIIHGVQTSRYSGMQGKANFMGLPPFSPWGAEVVNSGDSVTVATPSQKEYPLGTCQVESPQSNLKVIRGDAKKIHEFNPGMKVNDIAVAESGSIIAANGDVVKSFTLFGKLEWRLQLPIAYVTIHNSFIYGTSHKSKYLYKIRFRDGTVVENSPIPFDDPNGIAFNSKGDLYISSGDKNAVYKRKKDERTFKSVFSKRKPYEYSEEEITCPLYLAIDNEDSVFISSYYGNEVYKVNENGDIIWTCKSAYMPVGLTVNPKSEVYLAEKYNNYIFKLTQKGELIAKIQSYASSQPRVLAILNSKNQLIIGGCNSIIIHQL